MERPYDGIAIIEQTPNGYQITIPAKKHVPVMMFLSLWLVAWAVGFMFVGSAYLNDFFNNGTKGLGFDRLFTIVWLAGWTIVGLFVIKTLLWYLIGKEIIL
ncbi:MULTISPECIES: hypothetical protein [Sphingobacterium]|uniref:hypothetical protein n=1 Tax=Sphingobacterium TaxID=28453 RepID=UPI0008A40717|nr:MULTISPECIES: hypothetical protein [Sphingobacterium]HAF36381.1 hypothetical protein [Sphingobacterium sp.]OFV11024.1 hypothetical protein HMPREF3127_20490 [Sphingobacterium sp. HMSC13C05]HAK30431.1 hypothetical protein [Sphingobacterium sp.]HAL54103.1 hypothetical protein [Sphingobacterium sp.]HAT91698.1 hypothetical protein [Sphingobacterium sp.]